MNGAAQLVDRALELTVVGSFSRIGYETRKRLGSWPEPEVRPGLAVMVTGGTSGLGFEACVELAHRGASVTFLARDEARARTALKSIKERSGRDDVSFVLADMSDLGSVRRAADAYHDEHDRLDVLIHNAGALSQSYEQAPDGTELTVAAHVLGPFLLTGQLLPALRRSGREGPGPARVLTVSSGGMYAQRFELSRLEARPDGFDGVTAYARAKRAQVVLNREWARRIDPADVVFQAMHPGWADTPGVRSSLPAFYRVTRPILRTPGQGVDTLVWLAQAHEAATGSGRFWLDRQPRSEYKLPWTRPDDPESDQVQLWEWCAQRAGWTTAPDPR